VDVDTIATYDRIAGAFADQWWSTRLDQAMDRFLADVAAGVVLDLGCGPGRDTGWLAEVGFAAVGMDASFGMLAEARGRVDAVDVVRGDLVTLPFRSASADGAWVCASLLHLSRAGAATALDEVARVVRAGGAIFAGVQVGDGEVIKSSPAGDRHFTFWSPDAFAAAVQGAGFQLSHVGTEDAGPVTWVQVHGVRG
jgi:SAM-dependent methyltransferase